MRISSETWRRYQRAHALLQGMAKRDFEEYFQSLPWDDDEQRCMRLMTARAVQLVQRYGLADGELSAQLYDELMAMYGAEVEPAEIAEVDTAYVVRDVSAAVSKATSLESAMSLASSAVSGHVKRVGTRTMENAAARDGAMWAWVCIGDTCAFCRTLGGNGWQYASKRVRSGYHAEHVHDNCDCQFVVKPEGAVLDIEGYDPDALFHEYETSGGRSSKDKINAMRRADYTEDFARQRNERRRELYAAAHADEDGE